MLPAVVHVQALDLVIRVVGQSLKRLLVAIAVRQLRRAPLMPEQVQREVPFRIRVHNPHLNIEVPGKPLLLNVLRGGVCLSVLLRGWPREEALLRQSFFILVEQFQHVLVVGHL